jgi:peptidoglycan/xylan/chitin deacetylase (PgdA/CDA1 family)
LARLSALGHEIGCHTASHPEVPDLAPAAIDTEIERNAAFLRAAGVTAPMRTFAFPYGRIGPRAKRRLATRFAACRGVHPQAHRAKVDLAFLRCVSLEPHVLAERPLDAWLDEVVRERSWLILLTHDVEEDPSPYGVTPAHLAEIVSRVQAHGIETMPIADAVEALQPTHALDPSVRTRAAPV